MRLVGNEMDGRARPEGGVWSKRSMNVATMKLELGLY